MSRWVVALVLVFAVPSLASAGVILPELPDAALMSPSAPIAPTSPFHVALVECSANDFAMSGPSVASITSVASGYAALTAPCDCPEPYLVSRLSGEIDVVLDNPPVWVLPHPPKRASV